MSKTYKKSQNKNSMATFFKVLRFIGKYRFLLVLSVILAAVTVILQLYVPVLFGYAIDEVVAAHEVDFTRMGFYLSRILVMIVLSGIATWVMSIINNRMTYRTVQDIRARSIRHIQKLPLSYLDGHSTGDIISRVIADTDILSDGMLLGFTQLFSGIITIIGTLLFMFSKNVWITLMIIVLTPVSFFVAKFISSHSFQMFRAQSDARGRQTALIEEMIGNQKVVQAFGRGEDVTERFDEVNKRLQEASLRATFFSSITNPATRFVNSLVYTGVGITGAFAVVRGAMSVGQLSSFLSYANQYTKPFNEISGVVTEFQNAIACAQRVFTLIDEEPQIPEPEHAVHLTDIDGNVKVEDVSFSYLPGQHLIEDFNLEVKPGQRIAIVGPTGCGKTTLINLLMRFYDVNAGSIKVEDIDIREMTRKSLRAGYGMVLQETWLKTGTIRENIAMGRPDATEEEIVEAAKASHIHNYIRRLPKGYDTWITEDGGGLSQGQKQLLCIARVMLCRPPMLILDEATSSIDTRTEIKIQQAFAKLMEGRTTFIVAHRLSTIREADVILVMKDGKIIEQGNHEVLMKKEGFYHHLYESQFSM